MYSLLFGSFNIVFLFNNLFYTYCANVHPVINGQNVHKGTDSQNLYKKRCKTVLSNVLLDQSVVCMACAAVCGGSSTSLRHA